MNAHVVLPALIFSISLGVAAQQPKSGTTKQPQPILKSSANEEKRAAEIASFITYAQSVPAEFSVDLLTQLVESGEIKDPNRKEDLLVEAFYAAAKAKEPVKLVSLPGNAVDSRAGYRATALNAGLDVISLQSRAVRHYCL